ncbi:Methyltransferase domain protein [Caballeronia arvi]|uniref:Methyltransferase domain protein n=1 Tax=Caballeronia arvi TaxID=1777135 RepID=A0A158L0N2_9BURK|nr:class I SAM-dependent methyltransferase [Caballeronia arvi]SAL86410.1 Methyltransferase domain protein [Caballeronia arvi]
MKKTVLTRLRRAIKPAFADLLMSLPEGVHRTLMLPSVRQYFIHLPLIKGVYSGCYRSHPIDKTLGTDTSGFVDSDRLTEDQPPSDQHNPYMGSQPSIVRRALASLPAIEGYTFLDLGCGKGRAMIVATEYPFAAVLGCDISADLVARANANAKILATRFPGRTAMHAVVSDVRKMAYPRGRLVVFLYNSFGESLFREVLSSLMDALDAATVEHLFIVYYNPVEAHVVDAIPAFRRWSADVYEYAPNELNYGPSLCDTVVVWQSVKRATPGEMANCQRRIKVAGTTAYLD